MSHKSENQWQITFVEGDETITLVPIEGREGVYLGFSKIGEANHGTALPGVYRRVWVWVNSETGHTLGNLKVGGCP